LGLLDIMDTDLFFCQIVIAISFGASNIERHTTPDRTRYESDQADFSVLVKDIKTVISEIGSKEKKVLDTEIPINVHA